jgi:hypothetical protein
VLRSLSEEQCEQIEKGIEHLGGVSPEAALDVLVNVRHICYMDYARWPLMEPSEYRNVAQSLSRNTIPSTIFLSCHAFASTDDLVESLYHESLHRKLSNLVHTRNILKSSYDWKVSPRFSCYWNKHFTWGSNDWPFDRVLDAYHVYIHLFLLYGAVLESDAINEFSMGRSVERRNVSHERARVLGEWLYAAADDCMGDEGIPFLERMTQAFTAAPNSSSSAAAAVS